MTYEISDFNQLSTLDCIRANPSLYLPSGVPNGPDFAGMLVSAALRNGAREMHTLFYEGWWIVAGTRDWVQSLDQFSNIHPFADGTPNSVCPEVILTAFAQDVSTGHGGVLQACVKGAPPVFLGLLDLVVPHEPCARWVAFRCPPA